MYALAIAVIATYSCAAQDLNTVLAAHESSVASFQFLRCSFTNTSSSTFLARPRVLTGTITAGPSLLVVTAKATDFESLVYVRPDRVECLRAEVVVRGGKREHRKEVLVSPTLRTMLDVDPYRDMLVTFLGGALPTAQNSLRLLLKNDPKKVEIHKDGDEIRLLTLDGSHTIFLSVRNNYLVVAHEARGSDKNVVSDQKASVLEFIRSADGVVVPAVMSFRVTNTAGGNTTTLFDHTTRLTGIDTKPFDENAVKPRYPRDTKVTNMIDGTEYTIDEGGNVLGEVRPSRQLVALTPAADQKQLPTTVEPARTGWWILPASVSVLAIALAVRLLIRRRR
ncbi:hypothetical protein [Fimbriiglobus ruber]|uniref:hypothetical protein n=1 Tax=Fimbriiglobus ruber TaxID=1908690 RepID=UPI00117B7573|nr:hypothetical protein [Fimbriiglobus ruber]